MFSIMFKHASGQILVESLKYQKSPKILLRSRFQGMYWLEELHPAAQERSATSGSQGLLSSSYGINVMIF